MMINFFYLTRFVFSRCCAAWTMMIITIACLCPRAASVVKINRTATGWELLRNSEPYFVKGAGGSMHLDAITPAGGNSIRTWGVDSRILDQAKTLGLSVTMGIWDPPTEAESAVNKYRSHDALLIWGLGNEMESRTGDQIALWKQLNSIAEKVKVLDPDHPVMTVIAEIGGSKIKDIKANFPALDILGVNSYGGAASLGDRLTTAGWDKPYMVTEFGPLGHWEVATTSWGVPVEPTSSTKADTYLNAYVKSVGDRPACLGSFVFLWGDKQEKTHTWYGMFLPQDLGGNRVAAVDAMTFVWTGKWPADRCPAIGAKAIVIDPAVNRGDGKNHFAPGSVIACSVDASDPENGALTVAWDLRPDRSLDPATGGSAEAKNPPIAGAVTAAGGLWANITLPKTTGNYRVHVYVYDAAGGAATANLPIVVDAGVAIGSAAGAVCRTQPSTDAATIARVFDILGRRTESGAGMGRSGAGYRINGSRNGAVRTIKVSVRP